MLATDKTQQGKHDKDSRKFDGEANPHNDTEPYRGSKRKRSRSGTRTRQVPEKQCHTESCGDVDKCETRLVGDV